MFIYQDGARRPFAAWVLSQQRSAKVRKPVHLPAEPNKRFLLAFHFRCVPMLSSLRLAPLLYSPQAVNNALRRTRAVLKDQLLATSTTTIRYASSKPKGKGKVTKGGDHPTIESKPKEKLKSTASLIPGSQQPIVDDAAREEYAKAESTMRTSVEWFRKECTEAGSRANGRTTPALLKPVRVKMGGVDGSVDLDQVATVGVRDGTTLIVTVFDETVSDAHLPLILNISHSGYVFCISRWLKKLNELYTRLRFPTLYPKNMMLGRSRFLYPSVYLPVEKHFPLF